MRPMVPMLLLLAAASASAQFVESIEVRVTNVDVVVTDRQGNPVSGLTRDDFELLENGKPQTITNFYEIARREQTAVAASTPAPEAAPEAPQELRKRRLLVFLDGYSILPMARKQVVASLRRNITNLLGAGDEASVIIWNRRLVAATPFTSDLTTLHAALDTFERQGGASPAEMEKSRVKMLVQGYVGSSRAGGNGPRTSYNNALAAVHAYAQQVEAQQSALLRTLSFVVDSLAGVEGRKAMIFAAGDLPEKPGLDLFEFLDQSFGQNELNKRAQGEAGFYNLSAQIEKLARKANANGVTIYTIEAQLPNDFNSSDRNDGVFTTADFFDEINDAGSFKLIANITGGAALTGTKNFDLAFRTIERDLESYYSIGYRASAAAGERKIVVKTKRPGLRVRSRRSWVAKSADEQMVDRVVANVFQSPARSDFRVDVQTGKPVREKGSNTYRIPVTVNIPWELTLLPEGNELVGGFAVLVATGDDRGALSPVSKRVQPLRFPAQIANVMRKKPLVYNTDVIVRKGEQTLSISVFDQLTNAAAFERVRIVAP